MLITVIKRSVFFVFWLWCVCSTSAQQGSKQERILRYKSQLKSSISSQQQMQSLKNYDSIINFYQGTIVNLDSLNLYYQDAISYAQQKGNRSFEIKYNYLYASYLLVNESLSDSYKIFIELEPEVSASDYDYKSEFYSNFARLNYVLGYHNVALEYLKKSAAIDEQKGLLVQTSMGYNNLGIIYKSLKVLDSSLYFHRKSLAINIKLKDSVAISQSYNNLGVTYLNVKKDTAQALIFYEKALKVNPNRPTDSFLNNYAAMLATGNRLDDAKDILESLIVGSSDIKDKVDALTTLITIATKKEDYQLALEYYQLREELELVRLDDSRAQEIEQLKSKFEVEKKEDLIVQLKKNGQLQELANNQKRVLLVILIIVFILLFIAGALYIRNKQNVASNERLLIEQRLLRAQMNPHFIFNTLGAIQSFILEKNDKAAISYLSKFSKLIRVILDNSRHSYVSFETELLALENYLKLQQLRFNNSFTFNITQNEELKENLDVLIPPMLFQPFVENAIEHGFRSSKIPGIIDIEFILKENLIECIITDNGIGRIAAGKVADTNKSSLSSKITLERLELLGLKKNSIQIKDLEKGTQVNLLIPTKDYVHR